MKWKENDWFRFNLCVKKNHQNRLLQKESKGSDFFVCFFIFLTQSKWQEFMKASIVAALGKKVKVVI